MSGWNKPTGKPVETKKAAKPALKHGLIAGGVVAVLGCVLLLVFSGGDAEPKAKAEKKTAVIKEVTPKAAPTNKVEAVKEPKFPGAPLDWDKPYPPQAYRPDGTLKRYSRYVEVVTNKRSKAMMSVEELTFRHTAEVQIAEMLTMRPGDTLVGDYTFDECFVKSFLESLKEPIVIDHENDTPYQQDLKQLMIETKKDLKARYDAGEDLAEIMNTTRQQYKELNLYHDEIEKLVESARQERGGDMTEADEKDLINAANEMLKERGCDPLRLPHAFVERATLKEGKKKK